MVPRRPKGPEGLGGRGIHYDVWLGRGIASIVSGEDRQLVGPQALLKGVKGPEGEECKWLKVAAPPWYAASLWALGLGTDSEVRVREE